MTILRSSYLNQLVVVEKKHVSGMHLQAGKNWFLEDERILHSPVVCDLLKLIPT